MRVIRRRPSVFQIPLYSLLWFPFIWVRSRGTAACEHPRARINRLYRSVRTLQSSLARLRICMKVATKSFEMQICVLLSTSSRSRKSRFESLSRSHSRIGFLSKGKTCHVKMPCFGKRSSFSVGSFTQLERTQLLPMSVWWGSGGGRGLFLEMNKNDDLAVTVN